MGGGRVHSVAIRRQWGILKRLNQNCTEHELAVAFDVSERTIRRDLNTLEAAGFPLYDEWEPGENSLKVWRLATPLRKLL